MGAIASQIISLTIVLLNLLLRRRSKKTSKLRGVTGLCAGISPGTGELPAQMASYAENVSIWWRYHEIRSGIVSLGRKLCKHLYRHIKGTF